MIVCMRNATEIDALLREATRLIAKARALLPSADGEGAGPTNEWPSADMPLRLEDLNSTAVTSAIADLDDTFDTYHVVEHPAFRAAHKPILDRAAINQLTGKFLRRHQGELGIVLCDQRGRRRSARWRKT